MKKCIKCKKYAMMIFHTKECSDCFDFDAERKRKIPFSEVEMAQRNAQGRAFYQRNKERLAKKRREQAICRRAMEAQK